MSSRALISLLAYGLFVAGLATRNGGLLTLALPLIVYLAAGLLYAPDMPSLRAERSLSADRVPTGTPVEVTLIITNTGVQLEDVSFEDRLPRGTTLVEGSNRLLATLAPNASATISYTLQGARGSYHFSGVLVQVHEYLGLFTRRSLLDAPGHVLVLPELIRLRQVAIRPRRTRVYNGMIPARQGGPGIEFFGVREYQPGDPTRWINARASARNQQTLFVNEFEQERATDVCVILDVRRSSDVRVGDQSLLEHSVRAAAALADVLLGRGNRVGLLIYGSSFDWTVPGYGKVQRERILHALARAQLGDSLAFAQLDDMPTRIFVPRSQLVLISTLIDSDVAVLGKLRARGFQLLVVSPDPVAFELSESPQLETYALAARIAQLDRGQRLAQLRQAGVQLVNWQVTVPLHQMAQAALSRPPAFVRGL